jgi:hypothetical protein
LKICKVEEDTTRFSAKWFSFLGMASIKKLSNLFMKSQTTSLYYFNLGFLAEKFLLTCGTIKSESPLTLREFMFILMERFMTKIRDSY